MVRRERRWLPLHDDHGSTELIGFPYGDLGYLGL